MYKFIVCLAIIFSNSIIAQNPWNLIHTFNESLRCVFFKDSLNGYLASGIKLLETTDGGFTWNQLNITNLNAGINKIIFPDADFGIGVGRNGTVIISTDGGVNWVANNIGSTEHLASISVNNNGDLFACSGNKIFRSVDNGINWNFQVVQAYILNDIAFADDSIGYGVGLYNTSVKTTDGGITWFQIPPIINNSSMFDIRFISPNIGFVVGGSTISKTTNAGNTWNTKYNAGGNQLNAITTFGENFAWVVGSNRILWSSNVGETWIQQSYSPIQILSSVHSVNEFVCFAISSNNLYKINNGSVIPVELMSFNSSFTNNNVTLSWQTATEINNLGFQIERASFRKNETTPLLEWINIGFVEGKGTTTEINNYTFTDKNLSNSKYKYRLKQLDFDGTYKYYDLSEIVEISLPDKFELSQNYPNPFNPSTRISWQSPVGGWQTLKVYDVLGNEVSTLVNEYKPAGSYEIKWNASGFSSGVYFYRLISGSFTETKKMILLR